MIDKIKKKIDELSSLLEEAEVCNGYDLGKAQIHLKELEKEVKRT